MPELCGACKGVPTNTSVPVKQVLVREKIRMPCVIIVLTTRMLAPDELEQQRNKEET